MSKDLPLELNLNKKCINGEKNRKNFVNILKKNNLEFICGIYTSNVDYLGEHEIKTVEEHISKYKEQLEMVKTLDVLPIHVNVHSGSDSFTIEENLFYFDKILPYEKNLPFTISHETHRGRSLFNPFLTYQLLKHFKELMITADFSHWVVTCERLINQNFDNVNIMDYFCERSLHIHARLGTAQIAEVIDPMSIKNRKEMRYFENYWDKIFESNKKNNRISLLTPEYGYKPNELFEKESNEENSFEKTNNIILDQKERQKNRFNMWKNYFTHKDVQLPIIDISCFYQKENNMELKKKIGKKIHDACINHGFFYVIGHNVNEKSSHNLIDYAHEFFNQKLEIKEKILMDPNIGRGYQKIAQNITYGSKDYHEAIDFYREYPKSSPLFKKFNYQLLKSSNLWAESEKDKFKIELNRHIEDMKTLGYLINLIFSEAVMKAIAIGLELDENYFSRDKTNNTNWMMRVKVYLNNIGNWISSTFKCTFK
jgi:hypothetical protein